MNLIDLYLIDWFTLAHIAIFVSIGYVLRDQLRASTLVVLFLALGAGVGWEVFEMSIVEPLLNFREPFWNRWCTDLVADLFGAFIGQLLSRVLL